MKIKLLSWNIWFDCHFSEITKFIKDSDADILSFQEVILDDPERDIVTFMKGLGYEHALATAAEFTDDKDRHHKLYNAIFSKFPIIDSKSHPLREGKKPSVAEARIKVGDQVVSVFSVHLKHEHFQPSDLQNTQADTLEKLLPDKHGIVMGDFNALSDSYAVKLIGKRYANANNDFKPTWSVYPEGCHICNPQNIDKCLDYIFVSPDISFGPLQVGISKGSDHLPIFVEINI